MESRFDWAYERHVGTQIIGQRLGDQLESRMRVGRILVWNDRQQYSDWLERIVRRVCEMTDEDVVTFLRMHDLGQIVGA